MSLLAELKRRKVIHVAAAYLVVGWLVVQVASIGLPAFEAPAWALRAFILVVMLGFPIAAVMAWVFDRTPEGLKLETATLGNKRVYTVAAVLAALALGWFLRGGVSNDAAPATRELVRAVAALGERSTAVLPFVNMSSDKENEYFSDGLTETLLHKLAQVQELRVAARTSSFAFKGKQEDIRAIGRALGVATVVEGSVQRSGDTLRITAQLVRAADGSHIWSKNYDRPMADVFAIQDEIATSVAEALVGALMPESRAAMARGGTSDTAAYEAYMKGLQQQARGSFASLAESERMFRDALDRDPRYVDAMRALLWTWQDMMRTGMGRTIEFRDRAQPLIERLEALSPGDAATLAFNAEVALLQGDLATARTLYERAAAVDPDGVRTQVAYAGLLGFSDSASDSDSGDGAERGLAVLARPAELDPLNMRVHMTRSSLLSQLGRDADAQAAALRAHEIDRNAPAPHTVLKDLAARRGDAAQAIAWEMMSFRADPRDHEIASQIALSLATLGEFDAAQAWLAEAERLAPGHIFPAGMAIDIAYSGGDREQVLALGLALAPRRAEEVKYAWTAAMYSSCLAAQRLGRAAELRARLEGTGALPRQFDAAAFRALDAGQGSVEQVVTFAGFMISCLFTPDLDTPARREALLASLREILGPDWANPSYLWAVDGFLRGDRERTIAGLLRERDFGDTLRVAGRMADFAAFAGIDDDPRVIARIEKSRAQAVAQRKLLPQVLADRGLALTP